MENCLVTKLKGVVDNDNLDLYGYVKYEFVALSDSTLVYSILPADLIVYKNGVLIETPAPNSPLEANATYKIYAKIRYTPFYQCGIGGSIKDNSLRINVDDFAYAKCNFNEGSYPTSPIKTSTGVVGHIKNWLNVDIGLWKLYATNVSGSCEDIRNHKNAEMIKDFTPNSFITGNVSSLATLVNLTSADFRFLLSSDLYKVGLKGMLDGMFANGRTSGSLNILLVDTDNDAGITNTNATVTFTSSGWTWV